MEGNTGSGYALLMRAFGARFIQSDSEYRVFPGSVEEVQNIVRIAKNHHIALYPISLGHNWGYGGAKPPTPSLIVDMSHMNTICNVDPMLGLATVEPGVSMGQLRRFLKDNNLPFMAPVVGMGPQGSIIGNLLERGRAINASVDRFSSLMSLTAVMADGSLYVSSGAPERSFFKWGVGPYIDGLFGQSNIGIVVSATVALAPTPERTEIFFISIRAESSVAEVVDTLRNARRALGSAMVSFSVQNRDRISSRTLTSKDDLSLFSEWVVFGVLQGDAGIVRAARRRVSRMFSTYARSVYFLSEKKLKYGTWLLRYLPLPQKVRTYARTILDVSSDLYRSVTGEGSRYRPKFLGPEFEQDGSDGLLFVPAVLPMDGTVVEAFVKNARAVCESRNMEFPVSLLNFSDTCIMVGLLFVFDHADKKDTERARACYGDIQQIAAECGGYVYRASSDRMHAVVDPEKSFWQIAKKIKDALDPDNIISPGRYSL